ATDIAEAIDGGAGLASRAVTEHLNAVTNPQRAARQLGLEVASQLGDARVQWLILDDCHELDRAPEADELLSTIHNAADCRVLLPTRTTPEWATSRRVIYGELRILGREDLAMTEAEVRELAGPSTCLNRLAVKAAGWPALVALAATLPRVSVPNAALPESVHQYLADELYQRTPEGLRRDLTTLALMGDSTAAIDALLGARAPDVTERARELGFDSGQGAFELHPLMRDFLLSKLLAEPDYETRVRQALDANLASQSWDKALDLVQRFGLTDAIERVVSLAYKPLTRRGRLTTLTGFVDSVETGPGFPPPSIDVVAAETALRDGALELARDVAHRASSRLDNGHPLKSRAAAIGGQAHLFSADIDGAVAAFTAAREFAQDERDEVEALHGLAQTMLIGERPDANLAVDELETRRDRSPLDFVRFVTAHLNRKRLTTDGEGLRPPLHLDAASQIFTQVDDPRARTSFAYHAAYCLALRADYEDARHWLRLFFEDVERFELDFALPFGNWTKAMVALGRRRFAEAERSLQSVEDAAARSHRGRLLLQNGEAHEAIERLRADPDAGVIPHWRGEYIASRAIALACVGKTMEARASADQADRTSGAGEVLLLAEAARAIASANEGSAAGAVRLLALARRTAMWDAVVCAVRGSSEFADAVASEPALRAAIGELYQRSRDSGLARRAGLRMRIVAEPSEVLSERELEVLGLIARGYRNRQISQALFIADSTTKVHVRHILEKLGVRTRSEAFARYEMFRSDS